MRKQNELALPRQAMEDVERAVIVLKGDGRIQLATGRSRLWLEEYFGIPAWLTNHLPKALKYWVKQREAPLGGGDGARSPREPLVVEREGKRLVVRLLSDWGQSLLLLEEHRTTLGPAALDSLGLSRREAEVLRWVALGKTNVEVGGLLRLSPRTVQKHLEHIYRALGVETRTAAAVRMLQAARGTPR